MSAAALLADLRGRGVELAAAGETLRYRAPKGTMTPDLRQALADHKADLLAELECEATTAALATIEAQLTAGTERVLALWHAGERAAAAELQAELRRCVGAEWLPAKRRGARALDRLGRLPEADRFLLEGPNDEAEAGGWRWIPGGWPESEAQAALCVFGDGPLAPGDKLLCAGCRATADAMPATDIDGVSLSVPRDVAPDDPRLRELATVAALAAMHPDAAGGGRP